MTGPGAGGRACELFQGLLPSRGSGVFGAEGLADLAAGLAPRAGQAAYWVVGEAGLGFALAAQDFLVQVVALYVADELVDGLRVRRAGGCPCVALAQVDLVQVAAAVVQVVEGTLCGPAVQCWQHGLGAVAQRVVAVAQGVALASDFIDRHLLHQIAQQIVGKAGGVKQLEGEIGL